MPALEVQNKECHVLHRSNEPYRPPRHYKALRPSSEQNNDLRDNVTFGSSECLNQEVSEWDKRRRASFDLMMNKQRDLLKENQNEILEACEEHLNANMVKLLEEGKNLVNKCTELEESLESPVLRNFSTLQSNLNAITKQLSAYDKTNIAEGALTFEDLEQSTCSDINKNCSTKDQVVQDLNIHSTENRQQNSVNHVDLSGHIHIMLQKDSSLTDSEACTNLNVENWGKIYPINSDNNSSLLEAPPLIEEKNLFLSTVGRCGFAGISDGAIFSSSDVEQHGSTGTKESMSENDSQTKQGLESNFFSGFYENSNSSIELCLPDEDSLITFDELYYLPNEDNLIAVDEAFYMPEEHCISVDDSALSPERNSNENDMFNASSLNDMAEKLVESILGDEGSNLRHLGGATLHSNYCDETGWNASYHTLHAQQSSMFYHDQLNPGRNIFHPLDNQQRHVNFQRETSNTKTYPSPPCHHIPSNKLFHPCHLAQSELKRFGHDVSHPALKQMPILNEFSLPRYQMACYTQLNPMQDCTLNYQQPHFGGYMMPNPDPSVGGNRNQAVVDILSDMKERALHGQPYYTGGLFAGDPW
ncbi:Chorismate synthase [Quillaja saponaria]|nr:Chorismate synthase [Quillaja saponaria]